MPRQKRKLSRTAIYHIVVKGADRQLLFVEKKDFKKYLDFLSQCKEKYNFEIFAYCLMSNHVHLLIRHPEDISLEQIFRSLNTKYAIWFNTKYARTGYLQNGRYYSEPVESLEYLYRAIRYIHFNPTKAGLEKKPGSSYLWSSYYDYLRKTPRITDTQVFLEYIGSKDNFSEFHSALPKDDNNFIDIDNIRRHIPDDIATDIICETCKCRSVTEFQKLSISQREQFILTLHKKGISIRQLNRLTGTPRGIIERTLKRVRE